MKLSIKSKSCPNCGANLKFDINDDTTICSYCGSQIEIEHQKRPIYVHNMNINVKNGYARIEGLEGATIHRIYINKGSEVFKWISKGLISIIILIFGLAFTFTSNPLFGLMMLAAAVLILVPSTSKIFFNRFITKVSIVSLLTVVGFFGSVLNIHKLPSQFQGKYISDTTSMTVEIKGNQIIVNDNGKITKETIYCWEETYGTISYYNIKVNNGEYNFRLMHKGNTKYKFYNVVRYGNPENYFYNVKHQEDYFHYDDDE